MQFKGRFAVHHDQLGGGDVDPRAPPVGALQDEGGRCFSPAGLPVSDGQRVGAAGEICDSILLAGSRPRPAPAFLWGRRLVGDAAELGSKAGQFKMRIQKTLEKMGLLASATGIKGQVRQGVLLLCENGKSRSAGAANIPYTVPTDNEPFVEIPVGFFTNGWVHVLTTSEIAALLMWFDVIKFDPSLRILGDGSTVTEGFVRSDIRHGLYGLGRDAYETHQPLDAFGLLDVLRHSKRHNDGKWQNFKDDSSEMVAHRVILQTAAFGREAGQVVFPVLHRRHTIGEWRRPLR
ncbi:hypothetical protein [Streptomyces niveus]